MTFIHIPELKTLGHSMLAGAGVLTLITGLASQQVLGNLMSGVIIVFFKPFKLKDRITINGNLTGIVEDINLRQVVIRDFDNNRIIVPNSVISAGVIVNNNMIETKVRKDIEIGIGYDDNIESAISIMKEEIKKHPLFLDTRSVEEIKNNVPEVVARVVELGGSSVNIKAWFYANNSGDAFVMYCDLLQSIKEKFDKEGIDIPYDYQNLIIKHIEKEN